MPPRKTTGGYLLFVFTSRALVVRSIDLIRTRILGVIGELACFKGLKLRIAERILFETAGRVRMRTAMPFKVASTSMALLNGLV